MLNVSTAYTLSRAFTSTVGAQTMITPTGVLQHGSGKSGSRSCPMTKTYFKTYLEKWKILCKSGAPVKKLSMPKNGPPDETEYVQWATAFERGLGTTFFHLLLPGCSHGQTRNLESEGRGQRKEVSVILRRRYEKE
jgi:hypothetical protein